MIEAEEIETLIVEGIPGAEVSLQDLTGGRDHWRAVVISDAFEGKNPVQRHKLVYASLSGPLEGALHALQLETLTRDQARAAGLVQEGEE